MGGLIGPHDGQQVLLFHGVNLIDDQHGGDPQRPDAADELLLRPAHIGDGLHQKHHRVHVGHALLHHPHHVVAQLGPGLVEAGGVDEHKLAVPPVEDGADAVAGGLGLIGDDGNLLPHQGVGQGGLSHVGPPHDGDHAGSLDVHNLSSILS